MKENIKAKVQAPVAKPAPKAQPLTLNVAGSGIKSGFGRVDKPGARTQHKYGADRSYDSWGKAGTPINSWGAGKVASVASKDTGAGNQVVIDYGGGVQVAYNHLGSANVKPGQTINANDAIGVMGQSGYSPSGSHISYEFRKDGKIVPANVAFPEAVFPEDQWGGKQGSWGKASYFDMKTNSFDTGAPTGTSRVGAFNTGQVSAGAGLGQQVNLGLGNTSSKPARKNKGVGTQVPSTVMSSINAPTTGKI